MVHVIFDVNSPDYEKFFNVQYGAGRYYEGIPWQRGRGQRGRGAGKILKSTWRYLQPHLERIGKEIGKEGLDAGMRVLASLAQGAKPKEAIITEGKLAAKNLLQKGAHNVLKRTANQFTIQEGSGRRRRKKRLIVGRQFTKRPVTIGKRGFDALGPY